MDEAENMQEKFHRVIKNSTKYLDGITEDHINDFNYIPEDVQPHVNEFVRGQRSRFDILSNALNDFDKSSDEYIATQKEMENIAKNLVNARGQIDKYKNGIGEFKSMLPNMSKGTQDPDYYLNSAIFGNQWDAMAIDKKGMFSFELGSPGAKPGQGNSFRLNEMVDMQNGDSPIITEPWVGKKYVYDLAQKTKKDKDAGQSFNYDWTYNNALTSINEGGANNVIGMAFTDMAGDGQTKSFAEMYDSGLKDNDFYIHPETGETLPKDSVWMKDKKNSDVVSQLLARYISNTMRDLYGTIDKETGQRKKSQSKLATELIKKYSI